MPLPCLLVAVDELGERGLPTDERGHQRAWRMIFSRGGGTGSGAATVRSNGANVLGQARPAGGIDLQGGDRIATRQVQTHKTLIGLRRQANERQPAAQRD